MAVRVLALDLERTLISDALTAEPRPGLFDFLAYCDARFERVVLFTTVESEDARGVLAELARRGYVPQRLFDRLEFVEWTGEHKDLSFVPGASPDDILLVDDDDGWVRPDQRDRWVPVAAWDGGGDDDLVRVRSVLELRLKLEPESGSS